MCTPPTVPRDRIGLGEYGSSAAGAATPSIHVVCGPMFAGKTTELLRRIEEYESWGRRVAVLKSAKDNRYNGTVEVVSHDGLRRPCHAVTTLLSPNTRHGADENTLSGPQTTSLVGWSGESAQDVLTSTLGLDTFDVVAVDEAQFFDDLVDFCLLAVEQWHKSVIVAGLDGDFKRRPFGQVLNLIPLADEVSKLHSRCGVENCRARALFSLRTVSNAQLNLVGGTDVYLPVCRAHYVTLSKQQPPKEH